MSTISNGERHELGILQGMTSGTGTSKYPVQALNGEGHWRHEPTIIQKPNERQKPPPKKPTGLNPYSAIVSNDLNGPRGNPSAARTLVPTDGTHRPARSTRSEGPPPQKKFRASHEDSAPKRGTRHSGLVSPSKDHEREPKRKDHSTRGKSLVPPWNSEIIDVDKDSGEDLGELVLPFSESSDDLRLHQGERPGDDHPPSVQAILEVSAGPSKEHPFTYGTRQPEHYPPPPAGPQTNALKARINAKQDSNMFTNNAESESIEQYEERPKSAGATHRKRKATPSRETEFTVGHVRNTTKQYEEHNVLPEVDLIAKSRARGGKVVRMKTKSKSQRISELLSTPESANAFSLGKAPPPCTRFRKRNDDIATSSTNFESKGRKLGEYDEGFLLPIETWGCGARINHSFTEDDIHPHHWLCVQKGYVSIVKHPVDIPERKLEFELQLGEDVPGVTLPRNFSQTPCLTFNLRRTDRSNKLFQGVKDDVLLINVQIAQMHPNCKKETYERMKDALESSKLSLKYVEPSPHAARSLWEMPQRQAASLDSSAATVSNNTTRPRPRPAYAGFGNPGSLDGPPKYSATSSVNGLRRSNRNSSNVSRDPAHSPSPPADETILLYPFTGTGAVNVTNGDLKRLEPGEYLNDTLIELGLKLWLNDVKSSRPEFAEQVHVFSSFFYTQLNHKNVEEGYQSVRKWTSKFDLFKKKYIIVPINEHMHWYLAIICYPDRALNQPTSAQPPSVTTRKQLRESLPQPESHLKPISQEHSISPHRANSKPISSSSRSAGMDEQEVEKIVSASRDSPMQQDIRSPPSSPLSTLVPDSPRGEIMPETESEGEGERRPTDVSMKVDSLSRPRSHPSRDHGAVPVSTFYASSLDVKMRSVSLGGDEDDQKEEDEVDELADDSGMEVDPPAPFLEPAQPEQRPYIFSFDSLGARHPHALKVLSRYLDLEAKDKKGLTQSSLAIIKQASVPTQPNYCDCGVYLLHFVEQFMADPANFTRRIADTKKKSGEVNRQERENLWNHAAVASKRDNLKETILSLSSEWKREKEVEGKEKGKGKGKEEPTKALIESIAVDDDSDIEVLEVTPEPSKVSKNARSRTSAVHKAQRLR